LPISSFCEFTTRTTRTTIWWIMFSDADGPLRKSALAALARSELVGLTHIMTLAVAESREG
jgi:hypothetical protein